FIERSLQHRIINAEGLRLLTRERHEIDRIQLWQPAMAANGVDGCTEEIQIAYARNLDRVLKRKKDALSRPDLRRHAKNVTSVKGQFIGHSLVNIAACQNLGECALTGTVRAHDRVNLAGTSVEVQPAKDRLSVD